MQVPSSRKSSRWESIPSRENPRFPRNVHRAKRDPPKLVRRLSSRRSMGGTATAVLLQNECDRIDQLEGTQRRRSREQAQRQRSRRNLTRLDSSKIRFDRKGNPIIIVRRRSTATTRTSDITVDSSLFSSYEGEDYYEEDYDHQGEEEGLYISEEQSLVDDEDDDQEAPLDDYTVPRILVLALEPYNSSTPVHPSRIATKEIRKQFGPDTANKNFAVDTVAILTDSNLDDDDSRDDRYILAMAAIKKHIQRSKPEAVVVVTEDSLTSHVAVEGYDQDGIPTTAATQILDELESNRVPTSQSSTYGPEKYRQWMDRFQRAGLQDESPRVVFLHLPPFLPQTAAYQYHPRLDAKTSVQGIGLAISWIASSLEQRKNCTK